MPATSRKTNNMGIQETKNNSTEKQSMARRKFFGVVASDKMDKTRVVSVESVKVHPLYKKRYVTSKKYKVHDEKNLHKTGDKVIFVECRPLSKDKRWRMIY